MEFIVFWAICAFVAALIAGRRNAAGTGCLLGALLGPFGIIASIFVKGDRVDCPYCKELIRADATVCPHCQRDLKGPGSSPSPDPPKEPEVVTVKLPEEPYRVEK